MWFQTFPFQMNRRSNWNRLIVLGLWKTSTMSPWRRWTNSNLIKCRRRWASQRAINYKSWINWSRAGMPKGRPSKANPLTQASSTSVVHDSEMTYAPNSISYSILLELYLLSLWFVHPLSFGIFEPVCWSMLFCGYHEVRKFQTCVALWEREFSP